MIPDDENIPMLWDKYKLPPYKRIHCAMVRKIAVRIAKAINKKNPNHPVNEGILNASALLHDIDKNIEKLPGEHHPDAGVRILREEGMDEVAEVIRTHPLHMICQDSTAPETIEQQILFIADKMTKQDVIGMEKRFELWRHEDTDERSQHVLEQSYPKVLRLRDDILWKAGMTEEQLINLMK